MYAEVRGSGPAVLLVHAGGEDAEHWRPVAERLTGFTVVTYDRRGTLRSGRDDWPGGGSAQHADDAAGLLAALALDRVLVFGASSGGIPALQLGLRHPDRIWRALIYEPGYLRQIPDGESLQRPVNAAMTEHLAAHPGDWVGAWTAFQQAAQRAIGMSPRWSASVGEQTLFTPPSGMEWHAEREAADTEALVVDDIPILTRELVDEVGLANAQVDIRFAYGTASLPIFRDIATHLAALRSSTPDAIDGADHLLMHFPDAAAAYIRTQADRPGMGTAPL